MKIALAVSKKKPMVFRVNIDTIIAAFKRARTVLAIEDLRFSDSQHEGVTRLCDIGDGTNLQNA
ncbi:hypothetical protein [Yoonia sp. MH D7]